MLDRDDLPRLLRVLPGAYLLLEAEAGFTIVGASDEYLRVAHKDESIFGRPLFEVIPDSPSDEDPQGKRTLRASLAHVMTTGRSDRIGVVRYDAERPASEGGGFDERYWSLINTPMLDRDGRVELIVHAVEEQAAKANRKAVEILESIKEGFFTLDRKWRFDYVNSEAHRILGVEPGALAGEVIWTFYPGLEHTPFWDSYHRSMDERVQTSFTAFYANQQRWYEVTVFPAPEGISVYFRNVTDRKHQESQREALVSLSRRLADARHAREAQADGATLIGTTLGVSRVGYGTVDHDGGDLTVDQDWTGPGVESLSGVTPLRDYGSFLDDLQRGDLIRIDDVRTDPRTAAASAALEGKHARSFVNVPVMEHGRLVAVLFVDDDKEHAWSTDELAFIQEAAARIRTVVERATAEAVLRASEENLRRLNAELAEAGRLKDEFLATLAHELRNPLAPIRNALKLQSLASQDVALIQKTRALMERQVTHIVRLIDDLLDLSRLSRGLVEMRPERISLAPAIALAVEASRPFIEQQSHELALILPGEDLVVQADPVRITQVITNLLNNAAKFTPSGGRLTLTLTREGASACIRVRDNGIGLRPDALDRVFDMFEQIDRSHAQVSGGLGIGLTLVRRLVEAHGGSVSATSAGLGLGSEFAVRLPLSRLDEASAHGVVETPRAPTSTRHRILLADDNEDAAQSLAMLLQMLGHETRVVTDGAQAVALAETFRPDVAILDIAMPVMGGLDAARALRASFDGAPMLLLALSGFGQAADRERSAEAGFDAHLIKPVDLSVVEALLDAHGKGDGRRRGRSDP